MIQNKTHYLKSLFMIFLVLTMPIYGASVFAQLADTYPGLISSIAVYDDKKVHNLVRQNAGTGQSPQIFIDVGIAQQNVQASDVKFMGTTPFASCQNDGSGSVSAGSSSGSTCHLSLPNTFSLGRIPYDVLYQSTRQTSSLLVDGAPPRLDTVRIENSGGGKLTAIFDLVEEVVAGVTPNVNPNVNTNVQAQDCAGLAKIEIAKDLGFQDIVGSKTYNRGEVACVAQGLKVEFSAPTTSGDYDFYVRGIDALGWVSLSPRKQTVSVDVSSPTVDHFDLYSGEVKQSAFASGFNVYTLKVFVNENKYIASALADLSAYGGSNAVQGSCSKKGALFVCEWSSINIDITPSTSTLTFPVTIKDAANNELKQTLSKAITVDSDKPQFANLYFASGTGDFIGIRNNTLVAEISDVGVGINNATVIADLRSLASGYSDAMQVSAVVGNRYEWRGLNTNAKDSVTITVIAKDYFGQTSPVTKTFKVDTTAPVIEKIMTNTDFPSAGLPVPFTFTIKVSDAIGAAKVAVNARAISTTPTQEGSCTDNVCTLTIRDLVTGSVTGTVTLTVYDKAGNSVQQDYPVTVYRVDQSKVPAMNMVEVKVKGFSPQKIDRKIATKVPLKLLLGLEFEAKGTARVAVKELKCAQSSDDILQQILVKKGQNPYMLGQEVDNSYAFFTIKLDDVTARLPSIPVNCSVQMLVADTATHTIYQTPEIDPLLLDNGELPSIEIYNNPIGTPGDNVVKKLQDIKKRVDNWGGDNVLKIEKLLENLRNICKAIQTLEDVYNAVEALKSPIYGLAQLLDKWTGGGRAVWNFYLQVECSTRVSKEMLWPNNQDYQYSGASSLIGGTRKEGAGEPVKIGDYNVGGFVRQACAFTMCSQCSQGFGFADELANWGGVLPDTVGPAVAGSLSTGLVETTTLGQSVLSGGDWYGASSANSKPVGRQNPLERDETYRRAADEGLRAPQTPSVAAGGGRGGASSATANVDPVDLSLLKGVNFEANIDPFNNWFVAVGCACIPGIIHNMAKYQELQCIYAKCVSDHAKLGLSTAECDESNRYRECLFFKGNWFTTILWTIGLSWFQTMAQRVVSLITELPGRLVDAFRQKACGDWDNAVKTGATVDTVGANPFASAKSYAQCWSTSVSDAALDNQVGVAKSVACGLFDAGMLAWSWDNFQQNALNPDNYDSEKIKSDADKYCKDAFALLEDEKEKGGAGTGVAAASSTPANARPVVTS